jgi:hypothetical protein
MPPKQKESKKGPTYKPATPAKDIIPPSVKEPPREQKQLKIPDTQAENPDKNVTSCLLIGTRSQLNPNIIRIMAN